MIKGLWGKKIGMTQVYSGDRLVPVTAIDLSGWVVTALKTVERDGYAALQVGRVKDRYLGIPFNSDWVKNLKRYFSFVREIKVSNEDSGYKVGQPVDANSVLAAGETIDAFGRTKGCGFAGVVRRHNFAGPPASHGSTMGKRTGSLSFMASQGRVIKGKKMPGHMGNRQRMASGLEVVKVIEGSKTVLIKGSVPGKAGSLLFLRKSQIEQA